MEDKVNIEETIGLLKKLDNKSLLLIQYGAQMLVTKQELDEKDKKEIRPCESPKI